jgi:imidazolonepropionase-like amidohydrolase
VLEPCSCAFRAGAIARVADGVDAVRLAAREELQKGAQIKIMASGGVASPTDPSATPNTAKMKSAPSWPKPRPRRPT